MLRLRVFDPPRLAPYRVWEQEVFHLYLAMLPDYIFLGNRRLICTVIVVVLHLLFDHLMCAVAGTSGRHDVAKMSRNSREYTRKTVYHLLRGKIHQKYVHMQQG